MNDTIDPEKAPLPIRGPLQGLADASEVLTTHPVHVGTFLRGLTIGALVGAAVAGSAIWRRWRRGNGSDTGR
jgi:hypothetical protein